MASQLSLSLDLPKVLARFVESRVASGRNRSVSDVILEGLSRLAQQDDASFIDEIRSKIAVGRQQAEAGDLVDGELVFQELEDRLGMPLDGA